MTRAFLLSSLLVLFPNISKVYDSPELTAREIWEIRGKWSLQLRELHPEPEEIEVITIRYNDNY